MIHSDRLYSAAGLHQPHLSMSLITDLGSECKTKMTRSYSASFLKLSSTSITRRVRIGGAMEDVTIKT